MRSIKELNKRLDEREQEIERLNKRIKELEEGFKTTIEDLCETTEELEDWREEALRHREQLSEALKLINQLENRYKDKRIYVSRKYLKKIKSVLGSDKK